MVCCLIFVFHAAGQISLILISSKVFLGVILFTCLVGPKIREMSPSAKEKIRDDVHDAMAEKEEGKVWGS